MKGTIARKVITASIVIMAAVLLTFLWSELSRSNLLLREISVTVSATGEKNPNSESCEVWITKILNEEKTLSLSQYVNDSWVMKNKSLLSMKGDFTFKANVYEKLEITFVSHAWSGIVEISTESGVERYDLYNEASDVITIDVYAKATARRRYVDFIFFFAAACLFTLLFIKTRKYTRIENYSFKETLRYLIIPTITPMLFMFYLYYKNRNYLNYIQVLAVAFIFAAISALVYLVISRFLFNCRVSSVMLMICWIYFFTFSTLCDYVWKDKDILDFLAIIIVLLSLLLIGVAFIIARVNGKGIHMVLSTMLVAVFLINFIPSSYIYIKSKTMNTGGLYKTDFVVDKSLPKPNIYWIHTDAMMSFSSIERVFGEPQNEFRSTLQERGFVINEDAYFENGHTTAFALPMLLSPQFYDKSVAEIFASERLGEIQQPGEHWDYFDEKGMQYKNEEFLEARLNYEILRAFSDAGYHNNMIFFGAGYYFGESIARIYDTPSGVVTTQDKNIIALSIAKDGLYSLNDLLGRTSLTTFLKGKIDRVIFDWNNDAYNQYEVEPDEESQEIGKAYWRVVALLKDSFNTPSPTFTFLNWDATHAPFYYNENGESVNDKETGDDVTKYMPAHKFSVTALTGMVDLILEHDPDAVIILQGDHGVHFGHNAAYRQMFDEWGFTMQQVRDVWNGVMSAVRIPEKYGGLDAPLDPLNITRELVNRYVGQNYELLPADQPNQRKPYLTDEDWAKWDYNIVVNN